jgi:tRNA A-37 threonylcarbamoyl transferase component Bud32
MASAAPPTTRTPMAEAQQILCPNCHKPNLRRANFCAYCGQDVVLNNDGPMRFKITAIIKEGGQGAIYRAVAADKDGQPQGQPIYAIKEMLDRFTNPKEHDEALDRFEHEANLLKRLRHDRIPRIYADFKDDGRQYLAMDFVEGQDLEEVIKRSRTIPEEQALKWADEICDVLEYLHNQKPEPIIFRDMKPSNVMIEPDGNLKLIDFGIAKVFQHAQRGTQIGTPGYAPPEQYQGLATPSSDIYALAATLHHMLTGRDPRDEPPFSFPPAYGLKPTISKRTSEALQKALQMNPEDRFQSIAEFRAALRPLPPAQPRVAQKTTVLTPQPQAATPARPPAAAPPAGGIQPAVQARPAAPVVPIAVPAPPAQPRRRGGFIGGLLVLLLVLGLIGATLAFAFPSIVDQVLPGVVPALQPTAQTAPRTQSVAFTITDQEIIVPSGVDVHQAYVDTFLKLAQQKYGPNTTINTNIPLTFVGGEPEKIAETSQGTQYRATMTGYVAVPQQ